ncbi:MAG: hypothetical protein AAB521_04590 [Patescibacteria group bacterium]
MPAKERLIVEPARHPESGEVIEVYEFPSGSQNVLVKTPGIDTFYPREEVLRLGQGDFYTGVTRIGQAIFQTPDSSRKIGAQKPLASEARGNL